MEWQDLPEPKHCFTTCDTAMIDIETGKVIRNFAKNTKIVVSQKCGVENGTFYRTRIAAKKGLDWGFKAVTLGLPNEKAPSAHPFSPNVGSRLIPRIFRSAEKQKSSKSVAPVKDGGTRQHGSILSRLLNRK